MDDLGDDVSRMIEQQVMLRAVNDHWMTHLQTVEYIREGIGLRGYGQIDPLVAYKRETFDLFQKTLRDIRDQAVRMVYHARVQIEQAPPPQMMRMEDADETAPALEGGSVPMAPVGMPVLSGDGKAPSNVDWTKVGRNEPCPCGSGKKFKACHYPKLREQGVI